MKYCLVFLYVLACIYSYALAHPAEADELKAAGATRQQRQASDGDHHDAVDFGAHTGDHGAFGWYADFPVHAHED